MNIIVSNLGNRITDASLEAIFLTYGKVTYSEIIKDAHNGFPHGFAIIEMPDAIEAALAILNINGAVVDGLAMEAKISK